MPENQFRRNSTFKHLNRKVGVDDIVKVDYLIPFLLHKRGLEADPDYFSFFRAFEDFSRNFFCFFRGYPDLWHCKPAKQNNNVSVRVCKFPKLHAFIIHKDGSGFLKVLAGDESKLPVPHYETEELGKWSAEPWSSNKSNFPCAFDKAPETVQDASYSL